jgi:hypothetical protein
MSSSPYISFIACSRNDNHGGDLTRRMQIFVDCLSEQCDRHKLRAELVLVEWNPPPDRRPLAEELRWRKGDGFCDIRIITVPSEIHKRYKCAEGLPLFQMIAKNVGIRRAKGEFILCTNIDIVFTDELMAFLAKRELEDGCFYRSIRMDPDSHVPEGKPVAEVLDYCKKHIIRANLPRYSFEFPTADELSQCGVIKSTDVSINNHGDFIRFHEHGTVVFAGTGTQFLLDASQRNPISGNVLVLELATTNQESQGAFEIEFLDQNRDLVYKVSLSGRKTIAFEVPPGADALTLVCRGEPGESIGDQKFLPICILQLGWINHISFESVDYDCYHVGDSVHVLGDVDLPQVRYGGRRGISRKIQGKVFLQLPARAQKQKLVFLAVDESGKTIQTTPVVKFNGSDALSSTVFVTNHFLFSLPECSVQNYVEIAFPQAGFWYLTDVHVTENLLKDCWNICVSTLKRSLKRNNSAPNSRKWDVIPPGFEFQITDSEVLNINGKIVRGVISSFSLFVISNISEKRKLRLEILPSLPLDGQLESIILKINGKQSVNPKTINPWLFEFELPPLDKGDSLTFELSNSALRTKNLQSNILRYFNYHAFILNLGWKNDNQFTSRALPHDEVCWHLFPDSTDVKAARNPLDLNEEELPELFTNACGDFTLAKKSVWDFVNSYPELDLFSMHLDSVLLFTLHYAGFNQKILPESMVHYHIEHGAGWTPDGNEKMYLNLKKKNIPWLGFNHDVMKLILLMRRYGKPISFNASDWGMLKEKLTETNIINS